MNKRTNFEDTIFILNIRIRMIRDMLILDADPELFLGKTLDDIDFIDGTLTVLRENLLQHPHLIELEELFYSLSETEERFSGILAELSRGGGTISAKRFPIMAEKIDLLRQRTAERQKGIKESVRNMDKKNPDLVVSSNELEELLKDFKP
jgi:hypothetical protein